jgi:D-sedoheptulose 7-phosphate isomerase
MDRESIVIKHIEESAELKKELKEQVKTLIEIADRIIQAFRSGNKVFLFGNGGSAADAQHIAGELAGKFYQDREPLPALALTTNTSSLTAIANDYGFETVFSRQLLGLVKKGDIVIGMSTSGASSNVIRGIEAARQRGAITIAFTGTRGTLKDIADYVLSISSNDAPRIQEVHITAGHIICYLIEQTLFGSTQI